MLLSSLIENPFILSSPSLASLEIADIYTCYIDL